MKPITINVSEPVYRAYQERAREQDRTASELIREAMEQYRRSWSGGGGSLLGHRPLSVGGILKPLAPGDDLLEEMLERDRH